MVKFFLLLLLSVPTERDNVHYVDKVEINHYYDENNCSFIFDQIIFWEYNIDDGVYHVRDFRIIHSRAILSDEEFTLEQSKFHKRIIEDNFEVEKKRPELANQSIDKHIWIRNFLKSNNLPKYVPEFIFPNNIVIARVSRPGYKYLVLMRDNKRNIRVYARVFEITHTTYDPENENRKILDIDDRQKIFKKRGEL